MTKFLSLRLEIIRYLFLFNMGIGVILIILNAVVGIQEQETDLLRDRKFVEGIVRTTLTEHVWFLNDQGIHDSLRLLKTIPHLSYNALAYPDGKEFKEGIFNNIEARSYTVNIYGKNEATDTITAYYSYQFDSNDLLSELWSKIIFQWLLQTISVGVILFLVYIFIKSKLTHPLHLISSHLKSDSALDFDKPIMIPNNTNNEIMVLVKSIELLKLKIEERNIQEKKINKQLQTEKTILRSIIEGRGEMIWAFDTEMKLLLWNKAYEEYTEKKELPFPQEGRDILDYTPQLEYLVWQERIKRSLNGESFNILDMHKTNTQIQYYEIQIRPIFIDDNIVRVVCLSENITIRKKQEQTLIASLKEKEVLIRELYHRTKNNMNVISALLKLHGQNFTDPKIQTFFLDMDRRIRSLSLVHEKLYKSNKLSTIDLADYVQDLTSLLNEGLSTETSRIEFIIEIQNVEISVDTAMPIGLVLNEIILNAYEHGIKPSSHSGMIWIRIQSNNDKFIMIEIEDNGVGLPTEDFRDDSFNVGLQTVKAIVEGQLRGIFRIGPRENSTGARVLISFSDTIYVTEM